MVLGMVLSLIRLSLIKTRDATQYDLAIPFMEIRYRRWQPIEPPTASPTHLTEGPNQKGDDQNGMV